MNDFATEEFLHKNIRVRPSSGVTRGKDDGKTNDPYQKSLTDPYGPGCLVAMRTRSSSK